MSKLEGYKTLIVMTLALVAAVLQWRGIVLAESEQAAIATAILAVVGIALRLVTKGPAGGSGSNGATG